MIALQTPSSVAGPVGTGCHIKRCTNQTIPNGSALPELKMGHDLNKKRVLILIQEGDRRFCRDADIATGKPQGRGAITYGTGEQCGSCGSCLSCRRSLLIAHNKLKLFSRLWSYFFKCRLDG